ncbi:hypothetical protein [Catellatospora vulcania]|uniref:hypothetical protein n=1 Tax=Catellatospora vulcania TaxID=1460450 RepID=UPI0012D3F00C|nr:hypothetical protein [Catellatospora vulcania]
MTANPYRAPLLPTRPLAAVAEFESRNHPTAPPAEDRRPRRVRRVRSGIGTALAGHGLAVALPLLPATLADEPGTVYVVSGIAAQLLLAAVVVALGIARTVRRDGSNGVGLVIGWVAGVPIAAVGGIALLIALTA